MALKEKENLSKPLSCPDWLYTMMQGCWAYDAEDRLKCEEIVDTINDQVSEVAKPARLFSPAMLIYNDIHILITIDF